MLECLNDYRITYFVFADLLRLATKLVLKLTNSLSHAVVYIFISACHL